MNSIFSNRKVALYLMPLLGGILYASGFPMKFAPTNFFGPIFGLGLLFQALAFSNEELKEQKLKTDLLVLLCFCLGYNFFGYYWIPYTIKTFGGIPAPFNYMLGAVFSLIIAPHLIVYVIGHRLYKKIAIKSSGLVSSIPKRNCIYAIVFTLLEQFVPQQFPSHAGHSWLVAAPFLGLSKIFGAPLFSFINYWLALSIASALKGTGKDLWSVRVCGVILFISALMPISLDKKFSDTTQMRLVQARISNNVKIDSETGSGLAYSQVKGRFRDLSTRPSEAPLDLIVWPETAWPRILNSTSINADTGYTPRTIRTVIDQTNAEIFTGGYELSRTAGFEDYFESQYNSAFHFGTDYKVKNVYHKIKLIPFGESLPFGPFNKYLMNINKNVSFFSSGTKSPIFETKKGTPFMAAICYEILFSDFMRKWLNSNDKQPHFLINITNDSWYGDTAEPFQHLFLAKWRALEFNLPIVRMTNTGITSVIYPDGSESKRLGVGKLGILDVELKTNNRKKTIFQEYGLLPLTLFWIFLFGLFAFAKRYEPKN